MQKTVWFLSMVWSVKGNAKRQSIGSFPGAGKVTAGIYTPFDCRLALGPDFEISNFGAWAISCERLCESKDTTDEFNQEVQHVLLFWRQLSENLRVNGYA